MVGESYLETAGTPLDFDTFYIPLGVSHTMASFETVHYREETLALKRLAGRITVEEPDDSWLEYSLARRESGETPKIPLGWRVGRVDCP